MLLPFDVQWILAVPPEGVKQPDARGQGKRIYKVP